MGDAGGKMQAFPIPGRADHLLDVRLVLLFGVDLGLGGELLAAGGAGGRHLLLGTGEHLLGARGSDRHPPADSRGPHPLLRPGHGQGCPELP